MTSDGNNNRLQVGNWGVGELTVSGGAKLDGRANASACLLGNQWCNNFIGNAAGSKGTLTIAGAGSKASFLRAFVVGGLAVFRPPLETFTFGTPGGTTQGRVNILDGGSLTTDYASIGIGPGSSSALGTERSFADVTIDGAGSMWRVTGGTLDSGDGSLTLAGGSQIKLIAAPNRAAVTVGRDGSAFMRVRGGSLLDVGDGAIFVGRLPGSDGALIVSEGSTVIAGGVGVGRNKSAGVPDVDGGTATMVLNSSTLIAANIVIGSNGFLGGNGSIVGHVINHGIFSPGNSPGTMFIKGAFTAASGSRLIMEVQDDGQGGFNTDSVIFGDGSALDLAALKVKFRFLGAIDPNAFHASGGFNIDTFFHARSDAGVDSALMHTLFSTASFSAQADRYTISNFSFSTVGGAIFSAVAVPEPQSWLMLLAGLALVAGACRQRSLALRGIGPVGHQGGPAQQMPLC